MKKNYHMAKNSPITISGNISETKLEEFKRLWKQSMTGGEASFIFVASTPTIEEIHSNRYEDAERFAHDLNDEDGLTHEDSAERYIKAVELIYSMHNTK